MRLTTYDKKRRKELNDLHAKGELPPNMEKYWQWLNGKTHNSSIPGSKMTVYYHARRIVNEYLKDHTAEQAADHFDTHYSLIQRLHNKMFRVVPFEKAREISLK